jgi:hypothetical protein
LRKVTFILFFASVVITLQSQEVKKDSSLRIIRMWNVDHFGDTTDVAMDTTPDMLHLYNPVFQQTISSSWLGYTGSPYQNNSFLDRPAYSNFFFNTPLNVYAGTPEKTKYINTRKAYSSFFYVMNNNKQKREEVLHFIHSQNINKDWNMGFTIDIYSNNGLYERQKGGNHILSLFSSLNKKHYFYYLTVNFNNYKREENGGIKNDTTLSTIKTGSLSIPVNMGNNQAAQSRNRTFTLSYMHGYRFPSLVQLFKKDSGELNSSINHIIRYDFNKRFYSDKYNDSDTSFYQNRSFKQVGDSVRNHNISNELQLGLGNFLYFFKFRASAIYEINTFQYYSNFKPIQLPKDSTESMYGADVIHNASVMVSLSNAKKSFVNWNFTGQNYLFGYQAGDVRYHFNAVIKLNDKNDRLVASALEENITPSYGLHYFLSSRYSWKNDFSKINTLKITGALVLESLKLKIEGSYGVITNMVYFNESAVPDQAKLPVNVISLKGEKYFKFWKFRSNTRLLYQMTDRTDVIHIPRFAGVETFYFEHLLKFKATHGTMLFQTGVDLFYHTSFYADAYMPATSMFYLQNTNKVGNYPFIDLFINIKIKRVCIFLKFDHVFYPLFGYDYFTASHYAIGNREFKIGLRWLFYD